MLLHALLEETRNFKYLEVKQGATFVWNEHGSLRKIGKCAPKQAEESADQRCRILRHGGVDLLIGGRGDALDEERLQICGMRMTERGLERESSSSMVRTWLPSRV